MYCIVLSWRQQRAIANRATRKGIDSQSHREKTKKRFGFPNGVQSGGNNGNSAKWQLHNTDFP